MFAPIQTLVDEALSAKQSVVQAMQAMPAIFLPLMDLELSALRLIDSGDGWECRPVLETKGTVDLATFSPQLEQFKQQCTVWCRALHQLRDAFRRVPPEEVDDLFHAIPVLRTDRSLLDLSHGGL